MLSGGLRGLKSHRQGNTLQDTEKKLQFCNHYKKHLTIRVIFAILLLQTFPETIPETISHKSCQTYQKTDKYFSVYRLKVL